MYSTCLHCHGSLGANDRIEHFPVGQKLAFDPTKGRLWVVCARCRRWNLTPIEERWEAIEECDRLYRDTRLRASTDNIGLARLPGGLDLVRIGSPQLPEVAAWRYVGEFRRRWLTTGLPLAAGVVAMGSWQVAQIIAGPIVAIGGAAVVVGAVRLANSRGERARVVGVDGQVMSLTPKQFGVVLEPTADGWRLRRWQQPARSDPIRSAPIVTHQTGSAAIHTLRAVMTARNFRGARARQVDAGVSLLSEIGDPGAFITRLAYATQKSQITDYPPDIACALEIALHQDVERRALDGELTALEDEWALAEEIAGIADNLFLPGAVVDRHRALKEAAS
jgi:hypothetical protein